jgi:hypothetical protein
VRRVVARWRSHVHQMREQSTLWRRQWQVERDLEQVADADAIIAGPWCSEVGYEVLYWIPFLRWVMEAYRIPRERMIAVSRGGTASWYDRIASRYVEIFDHVEPERLRARAVAGALKQHQVCDLDREIADRASTTLQLPVCTRMLHPSLMFRWFAPFWSGHETLGFVERHTRFARMTAPDVQPPQPLPDEYAAVKLYSARSLPDSPAVRAQVDALLDGLSARLPLVHLDTGLGIDDHADYAVGTARGISLSGRFDARTNLAVQTRIVAGARLYVGTCGSLAWLAPLLGVPTLPLFTDASFLHAHLHVARRVFGRVGAAQFSPLELTGILDAGLAIGAATPPALMSRS